MAGKWPLGWKAWWVRVDLEPSTALSGPGGLRPCSPRLALRRMSRQVESIRVEGTVKEVLPHALFKVEVDDGSSVLAHVSGELRMHLVRVLPGHRVVLAVSPYDLRRGRIVSLERSPSTGP